MTNDPNEALKAMGLDLQMIDIYDDRRSVSGNVDRRICICGHAATVHTDGNDIPVLRGGDRNNFMCKPNAQNCPCKRCIPVIKVSNSKFFLRKTHGAGATHALVRGLRRLAESGGTFEWLVEVKCTFCGSETSIAPTPLTATGELKKSEGSAGYDNLVCENCRSQA